MPHNTHNYKLALFDMDSTLIDGETIDELAREVSPEVAQQVAAITQEAMEGKLDFDQALRARVKVLAGLSEEAMDRVSTRLISRPGAKAVIEYLKTKNIYTAVVSGGFLRFAKPLALTLGMDGAYANDLEVTNGVLTGRLKNTVVVNAQGKAQILLDLCKKLQCSPLQAIAVGDGANDIPMIRAAGLGIAIDAKPALKAVAKVRLQTGGDLTQLLKYLKESIFLK